MSIDLLRLLDETDANGMKGKLDFLSFRSSLILKRCERSELRLPWIAYLTPRTVINFLRCEWGVNKDKVILTKYFILCVN